MAHIINHEQRLTKSSHNNHNAGNITVSDIANFRHVMDTVHQANDKAKDEPAEDESPVGNLNNPDALVTYKDANSRQTTKSDDLELLSLEGSASSSNKGDAAGSDTTAVVDFSTTAMSLDEFSLLLQQITQQQSRIGQQWMFSLQDSLPGLKNITLQQTAPGQWALSLRSSSQADVQHLSRNLDKLLQRLRATGQVIDRVDVERDKNDSGS